jgi:hypothetical protein
MTGHLVRSCLREDRRFRGSLGAAWRRRVIARCPPPRCKGGKVLFDRDDVQSTEFFFLRYLAAGRCRGDHGFAPWSEAHQERTERSVLGSLTIRWLVTHESTESWPKGLVGQDSDLVMRESLDPAIRDSHTPA